MSTLHADYPSKPIIVDECSPGIIPYSTGEVGNRRNRQLGQRRTTLEPRA